MIREWRGDLRAPRGRVGVLVAEVNRFVTERLLQGALQELRRHGVSDEQIDVFWVPGSFEIPAALEKLARARRHTAVVCLGCIIHGETEHYYFVARETAQGIAAVARQHCLPVGFGVLTTATVEQALERASTERNIGAEAARAALHMADLFAALEERLPGI
jgi:6,7-dimethyl-8-ribityllumazine synthase